jgi:hypothetical protein
MHPLQIRDHLVRHLDDLDRPDVVRHLSMDLSCDMDQMHLLHLHQLRHLDVVQNLDVMDRRHLPDVVHLDVQQNLDVVRQVVEHPDVQHPLVAVVDAELLHQLRMDYFPDVVDAELRYQLRMDYFQDEVLQVHPVLIDLVLIDLVSVELQAQMVHQVLLCMQLQQQMLPVLPHVMPSVQRDPHRALLQVQQQVLD